MRLRRVLGFGLGFVLLVCGGGAAAIGLLYSRSATSTAGKVDFVNPLALPPLAPSRLDQQGRRVFELKAAPGDHDFGDGAVGTWGFNGSYLGPTLRAKRGEQVVVNVHNELPEVTSLHWHGMHLPAKMDGGPHQPIEPGATWSPGWLIDQPAATLWYHPHPHGETADQVYRGLAGMFIIDDPKTEAPDLPHRYGVDDIPVIVQDKNFDGDELDDSQALLGGTGILGRTIVVNGTLAPYQEVTTERVRLRLLNAANARTFDFGFVDQRGFALVGTDGGLLAKPYDTTHLALAPGERAEIVVALRPGERVVLRSSPHSLGTGALGDRFVGAADTFDVLQLRAAAKLTASPAVPAHLVELPRLDPAKAVQHRSFKMSGTDINGAEMDLNRVDATVVKGSVEVWTVTNSDGSPHSFHIHDVQFQVLSVDGHTPPPPLRGWKDTVFLQADQPYQLIARFADYADPDMPYMFHCHILRHEDSGMMGQFVVVEPGQQAGSLAGMPGMAGHQH